MAKITSLTEDWDIHTGDEVEEFIKEQFAGVGTDIATEKANLLQRIQGKSSESRALDDPFIWLGEFNNTSTDGVVTELGTEAFSRYTRDMLLNTDFFKYTGHGRAMVAGTNQDIWTYFMGTRTAEYTDGTYELKFFAQKTRGRYGADALGNLALSDDHDIQEAERTVTVKRFVDGSPAVIESVSAWVDGGSMVKDLGVFNSTNDILAAAAKFGIVRDYRIAMMVARVNTSDNSKKSSIVIQQQITANSDGTYTTWQYIFEKNQRYTRCIESNATAVTAVQSVQKDGARNLEYGALGYLKLTNPHGEQVGSSVDMRGNDQSALREGNSTADEVRLVQTKTFGNTNEVAITKATSAKAGVMTAAMYNTLTRASSTANEAKSLATYCDSKIKKYAVRYMTPAYGSDGVSSVVCKAINIPISATNTNTIKSVTLRIGTGAIPSNRPAYMHIINGQTGETFGSSDRFQEMDTNQGKYLTWTFVDGVKISDDYGSYVAIGLSTDAKDVSKGVRLNFNIYANKNATNNEIQCIQEDGTWQNTWQPELAINIAVPNELVRLKGATNAEGIDLSLTDFAGGNESASVRIPVASEGTIGLVSGDVVKEINDKAPKVGYAPDLKVNFAKELVGRGDASVEEIGVIRPTGVISIGDGNATIERIKGRSVVWNQIFIDDFNNVNCGIYQKSQKGEIVLDGILTQVYTNFAINVPLPLNHKGLFMLRILKDEQGYLQGKAFNLHNRGCGKKIEGDNTHIFYTNTTNLLGWGFGFVGGMSVGDVITDIHIDVDVYNLTKMFGAGNEPTTIEEFEARKPLGVTNKYNSGTIVSYDGDALKSVGFNAYNGTYAKVIGGEEYHATGTTSISFAKELGGDTTAIALDSDNKFTPEENGYVYAKGTNIVIHLTHSYTPEHVNEYEEDVCPLPDVKSILDAEGNPLFPYGLLSAGSVHDEITATKAIKRVGKRSYAKGDKDDVTVITDGTSTLYALDTPIDVDLSEPLNMTYDAWDFGTEELIADTPTTPLNADIVYQFNAVDRIRENSAKNEDLQARIEVLESMIAQLTTQTTNDGGIDNELM